MTTPKPAPAPTPAPTPAPPRKKWLSKRAPGYSINLMKQFRPLGYYVKFFGCQPFEITQLPDGTSSFVFKPISFNSALFFFLATLTFIAFVLISLGLFGIFIVPDPEKAFLDRCSYTWETTMLARHIVPVFLTWTWVGLTAASGLFIFLHGKSYGHYFTFWNKAVQRLDMDVTAHARNVGWIGNVDVGILFMCFIYLFVTPASTGLNDTNALIIQAMGRIFGSRIYVETLDDPCGYYETYHNYTILGFCIQIYSLFASRCFVIQFRFFSRMLKNTCHVWNNRLDCALAHLKPDDENTQKRRVTLKLLFGDHLTIVQLFKMTDNTFSLVLQCFYSAMTVDLCLEVYYISRLGSTDACESIIRTIGTFCPGAQETIDAVNGTGAIAFTECGTKLNLAVQDAFLSVALIIQTIFLFTSVTIEGSKAYEEAMRGMRIARRYGFMFCRNRKERNFMHSLQCSFAPNNPMQIAAGGYVNIGRPFVLVVTGTVLTYFIILLQFRPSVIEITCAPI